MAPDLPEASGGIKMMYRIVEELVGLGHDATVWHGSVGHRYDSFASTAPVHRALTADLVPGDVLVMHEVGGPRWSFLPGDVPVVMLCQGWVFVLQDVAPGADLGPGYPGWPQVRAVLPTSAYIERYVRTLSGPDLPVYRVPVVVDGAVFRPGPKRRVVAYMPRRRGLEAAAAIQLLRRSGRMAGWEFRAVDAMTEAQVAATLGEAAVYLSGAERDGFGLPAAEAMAAGCYVVGFTGDGGAEFMDPAWCTVVHDSDVLGLADGLAEAARRYDEERAAWQEQVDRGRALVLERYDRARMRVALDEAFGRLLADGSDAVVARAATVPHYQAHAPATGWHHETYRWARRTARRTVDAARRRSRSRP
jgi:hypothetical protein